MKMYLHLLMAASLIAPACAYGMEAPKADAPKAADVVKPADAPVKVEAPAAPAPVVEAPKAVDVKAEAPAKVEAAKAPVFPMLRAPQAAVASQWKIVNMFRWLHNHIYPSVPMPTIDRTQGDPADVIATIKAQAELLNDENSRINTATKTLYRRLTTAVVTSLPFLGVYAAKYGRTLKVYPIAASVAAYGLMQFALPKLNSAWNRRVIDTQTANLKTAVARINDKNPNPITNAGLKDGLLLGDANKAKQAAVYKYIDEIIAAPAAPVAPAAAQAPVKVEAAK